MLDLPTVLIWAIFYLQSDLTSGLTTFEKVSNVYYDGSAVSTHSPVTLAKCIQDCQVEDTCLAVSFAVPSMSCAQFNSTASDSSLISRPNTYYIEKVYLPGLDEVTANACSRRLWAMERFPQKTLRYAQPTNATGNTLVKVVDDVPDRSHCSGLCLQEINFVCEASLYNYTMKQCTLLANDRRMDLRQFQESAQSDYTENLCIPMTQRCSNSYTFERYNDVVFPPFYWDKTVSANSAEACSQLCLQEPQFPCRSFLYRVAMQNCALSHNDRHSYDRPILQTLSRLYAFIMGRPATEFYEFTCLPEARSCLSFSGLTRYSRFQLDGPFQLTNQMSLQLCEDFCLDPDQASLCNYLTYFSSNSTCTIARAIKPISEAPNGFAGDGDFLRSTCRDTQLGSLDSASGNSNLWFSRRSQRQPPPDDNSWVDIPNSDHVEDTSTVPSDQAQVTQASSVPSPEPVILSSDTTTATSLTTGVPIFQGNSTNLTLPGSLNSSRTTQKDGLGCRFTRASGRIVGPFVASAVQNVELDACELQCDVSNSCLAFSYSPTLKLCLTSASNLGRTPSMLNTSSDNDFVFYEKGTECTDVRFECTDSDIVIKITTEKPFHGRLFVEGSPAPQCAARFNGQRDFSWSVPLSAEPCGTIYDGNGEFSSTVTLQTHDVLVTKNDRRYQINCKYDVGVLNVSSSALTVMSPPVTNLSLSPIPPALAIQITDLSGHSIQTAVLGDTLLFSVVMPEGSPYGISAKNCYAFGSKENERMQLTDDTGCPVLPEFFRPFHVHGKGLQAEFDAFRFRNSYVITYQCTVNYCLDMCSQPVCETGNLTSHTRRKREESFLGAYNLRRQLQVDDSPEAMISPGKPVVNQDVCLTNSVLITLAVFAGLFLILNVVLVLVAIRLHRRQKNKIRDSLCTVTR